MRQLHLREYDTFLSHAGDDRAAADRLYHWLEAVAGIKTWYYHDDLAATGQLAVVLGEALDKARSLVLALSKPAAGKPWVVKEYSQAETHESHFPGYAIVPVKVAELADAALPGFLASRPRLPAPDGRLTLEAAAKLAEAFYPPDGFDPETCRDVYVSCSWQTNGPLDPVADRVCREVAGQGFRLVGDPREHKFDNDKDPMYRVRQIIESCGALVAVLPHRPNSGTGKTSQFMLDEIALARAAKLPVLVVPHPAVGCPDDWAAAPDRVTVVRLAPDQLGPDSPAVAGLRDAVEWLSEVWRRPPHPHVFLATAFKPGNLARNNRLRDLIQRVTGLRCVLGVNLQGDGNQKQIVDLIRSAYFVVADVSGPDGAGGFADNLNTCIEAGAARGAGRPLHLVAGGPARPPEVYMFKDIEVKYYQDDAELIGWVHRHIRPYRRRVINRELG